MSYDLGMAHPLGPNDDPQQILYGSTGERHLHLQLGDLGPDKEEMLMHAYLRSLVQLSSGLREYKTVSLPDLLTETSAGNFDFDPTDLTPMIATTVIERLDQDNHIQFLIENDISAPSAPGSDAVADVGTDMTSYICYRPTEEGVKVLKMWDLRKLSRMQL